MTYFIQNTITQEVYDKNGCVVHINELGTDFLPWVFDNYYAAHKAASEQLGTWKVFNF